MHLSSKKKMESNKKQIKFSTDFDVPIVIDNFLRRGWKQVCPEEDWNIYWSNTMNCRSIFSADNDFRLNDNQVLNHFPNHYELVRKDLLVKNIKKYRRNLAKQGDRLAQKESTTLDQKARVCRYLHLDFIPVTYALPSEYKQFVEDYRNLPQTTWIIKPCGKSQGAGIFLINKLSTLKQWSRESKINIEHQFTGKNTYIISRYIDNPLLIGGKKFDLRIYVLVTSFRPLKVYMFREGFCRFCTMRYDKSESELKNVYVHLTNVCVQRQGQEYNGQHGGKLGIKQLRLYLEGTRGKKVTEHLFEQIQWLIVHSLKAVAPVMINDRHCFECYGYDIIIDKDLKPWLIEVNASPAMAATTVSDRILKDKLVDNMLSIVLPPNGIPNARWNKTPSEKALGDFEILVDEDLMQKEDLDLKCKERKKAQNKM